MIGLINKFKRVLRNELIYMVSDILIKAIAFLSLPFFVNIMSTAEFGEFSLYQTYISVFSIFFGFNINQGIVRYYIDKENEKKYLTTAVWINIICGIFFSALVILVNNVFNIINMPEKALYAICIGSIFSGLMNVGLENVRAMLKAPMYGLLSLLSSLISTFFGMFLVYTMTSELGYWRLVSLTVSYVVVGIVLVIGIVRRDGLTFKKDTAKYLLVYSIPLIPYTLSTTIIAQINRVFLADVGLSEVGIFSFASNLAMIIYIISISLNRAFQPFLFTALRDSQDYKKHMYQNMGLFYIIYVGFIFFSDILIWIFGNEQYFSAIEVIPILTLGYGFCFLYSVHSNFLYYYKKSMVLSFLSVISAVITIIFNMTLIPLFGYIGASISMAGSYFVMFLLAFVYVRRRISIKLFSIFRALILSIMLIIPVAIKIIIEVVR